MSASGGWVRRRFMAICSFEAARSVGFNFVAYGFDWPSLSAAAASRQLCRYNPALVPGGSFAVRVEPRSDAGCSPFSADVIDH